MDDSSVFDAGWLEGCAHCVSPNADDRPDQAFIDLVVIHFISLPPDQFGSGGPIDLFTNRLDLDAHPFHAQLAGVRVSAHFFIDRSGQVTQLVSCDRRAWHAGQSEWEGRTRCNDFSIGIELEGSENHPFELAQYDALNQLLSKLMGHYPIRAIVGHSDVSPGRKIDPGPWFEWSKLSPHLHRVKIPSLGQ